MRHAHFLQQGVYRSLIEERVVAQWRVVDFRTTKPNPNAMTPNVIYVMYANSRPTDFTVWRLLPDNEIEKKCGPSFRRPTPPLQCAAPQRCSLRMTLTPLQPRQLSLLLQRRPGWNSTVPYRQQLRLWNAPWMQRASTRIHSIGMVRPALHVLTHCLRLSPYDSAARRLALSRCETSTPSREQCAP